MTRDSTGPTRFAVDEVLRNQLHSLAETIGGLIQLTKSMPEGETRG